ncbi:hypothetical protein [Conexibacter woesei]|uniref:hypothetical protein n=1 Tax=Conexibacter woesei TaxID=191495 RepID=UPI0005A2712B|nr:hypothetical protein [Conexibacter woesei]
MEQTLDSRRIAAPAGAPERPTWLWSVGMLLRALLTAIPVLMLLKVSLTPLGWDDGLLDLAAPVAVTLSLGLAIESRGNWKLRFWPILLVCVGAQLSSSANGVWSGWAFVLLVVIVRYVATVPANAHGRRAA